ncbi:MAG: hypothetical protein JSW00_08585, partial [Thermoplasmata archaeon]
MNENFNEETINSVSKKNKHFLRRIPKFSIKTFALFSAGILILTSLYTVRADPINVDASTLPWYHDFTSDEIYRWINLINIKHDMIISLKFINVDQESDLTIAGENIGTIQAGIVNLFLYRTYNMTDLSITFTITPGLRLEIDRVKNSDIPADDNIHICGKTYFTLNGKHIVDISIPSLKSHKADLNSSGTLTYMAFTEYPAFEEGISRYGFVNNNETPISLPRGTKVLRLLSNEITDFDVVITPYQFDGIGIIDVIGTSEEGDSKYVRTITSVQQIYNIKLICLDNTHTIAEGSSTNYLITVANLGNGPDTVNLTIEIITGEGWDAILSSNVVDLDANESTDVTLTVTSPPNSDGQTAIIKVNGTSQGNESINSSIITTTLSKKPGWGFRIEPDLSRLIYPTEKCIYQISIYNFGTVEDEISLNLSDVPGDWNVSLSNEIVIIDTNESKEVNITIIPPPNSSAGEYPITIIGISAGNSSVTNSTEQNTSIQPIYDVELSPGSQLKIDAPKGSPILFPINISNPGNAEEEFNISIEEGEGDITDIYGNPITNVTLLPFEITTVHLHTFSAPTPNTTTYTVINVSSEDDPNATDNSTAIIITEPIEGGTMSDEIVIIPGLPIEAMPTVVKNGEELNMTFVVKNDGDQTENITVTIDVEYNTTSEGLYDFLSFSPGSFIKSYVWEAGAENTNWTFTLDDDDNTSTPFDGNITLGGGESQEMRLLGSVPNDVPENEWAKFDIKAAKQGNPDVFDILSGLSWVSEIDESPSGPSPPGEGGNPPDTLNSSALFNITCVEPIKSVKPGLILDYTITVINYKNSNNTINFTLYGIPSGWDAYLSENSLTLGPLDSGDTIFHVHPPVSELAALDADIDDLTDIEEASYNTDKLDLDSDNDKFWDGAEKVFWELQNVSIENITLYLDNPDIDNDTLLDGDEVKYFTNPFNPDTDGDGFLDGYEVAIGTDPLIADSDADGLEDDYEIMIGTNPLKADTDHDGLTDYQEINYDYNPQISGTQGTDPLNYDTDYDGLWDGFNDRNRNGVFDKGREFGEDVNLDGIITRDDWNGGLGYGETNPLISDMDGDGLPDGWEAKNGLNPLDSSDLLLDLDGDGMNNLKEYQNATNPLKADTDYDGLEDLWELNNDFDPKNNDMDDDGMTDGWEWFNFLDPKDSKDAEYDFDNDGLNNFEEFCWASDINVMDSDNDGFKDGWEVEHGLNPSKVDSDDDGLPDAWEVQNDPGNYNLHPNLDKDNDQLSNFEEYQYGTNVSNPDSDSDGFPDGWEVKYGLSPTQFTDGNLDLDNDSLTIYQEYENDTDP